MRFPPAYASSITCWSFSRVMARFDLKLKVKGDLDVDQHHTVEDVGIALGEAFRIRRLATKKASCAPDTS